MDDTVYKKVRDFFSDKGLLSSQLRDFEYREEQVSMAEAVLDALAGTRNLIVEAGTGVGKSLAYLVPLSLWLMEIDNPRAIVSTYTKALQRQLFEKELPFIKKHLFPHLRYAVSFGSDNYLCLKRLGQARQYGLFDGNERDAVAMLMVWAGETLNGLKGEIDVNGALWQKVNREADMCSGRECRHYNRCFYQTAKVFERKANIIITNHHLFFAHVASNYNVLPGAECVVFDEAHEIENVATDYLGIEVSNYKLRHLLDTIISPKGKGLLMRLNRLDSGRILEISAIVDRVRGKGEAFFSEIREFLGNGRSARAVKRFAHGEEFLDALSEMSAEIETLDGVSGDEEEKKEIEAIIQRSRLYRENLKGIHFEEYEDYVYWASQANKVVRFTASPLNMSDILRETVFDVFESCILTSATLSTADDFSFIKDGLGLDDAQTALFASPFDFKKQAVVYIPDDMPAPNSKGYTEAITEQVETILRIAKGNTMVLFTNYSLLHDVAAKVNVDYRILTQGEMDNSLLLEEFKNGQPAALFGTYTFWQGIDFQGEILKCVVITKLPFSVPTEPVLQAKMERIISEGGDPFYEYQVPNAAIIFKQGFGRLIRSGTDRGVAAVLDSRILKKNYGKSFLNSLPETEIVNDVKSIKRFLKQGR